MNRKSYILLGLAVLLCIGEACAEKPHPVNAPTQSIKEVQQKKKILRILKRETKDTNIRTPRKYRI